MRPRQQHLLLSLAGIVLAFVITLVATGDRMSVASTGAEICEVRTIGALTVPGEPDAILLAAAPDCGTDRKVWTNAKGEYWCCNKDDICVDTPGGCKKVTPDASPVRRGLDETANGCA
jgi:hypothetical protein